MISVLPFISNPQLLRNQRTVDMNTYLLWVEGPLSSVKQSFPDNNVPNPDTYAGRYFFFSSNPECRHIYLKRSLSWLSLDVALTYWSYFIGNEDNISAEFDQSNITCPSIGFLAVHFVNSWLGYTNTLNLILVWPVSHLLFVHHSKVDTEAM